jgi:hypothetical protein
MKMARLTIDLKEKTKEKVLKMVPRTGTIKKLILDALGVKDE